MTPTPNPPPHNWNAMGERERDALVAEKVMGYKRMICLNGVVTSSGDWLGRTIPFSAALLKYSPRFTTSISDAMKVVDEVQKMNPGWRFCLLGGDREYGYVNNSPKDGVDESRLLRFGWHAEFFGHHDPRLNTGQRHGRAYAATREHAICLAALRASGLTIE